MEGGSNCLSTKKKNLEKVPFFRACYEGLQMCLKCGIWTEISFRLIECIHFYFPHFTLNSIDDSTVNGEVKASSYSSVTLKKVFLNSNFSFSCAPFCGAKSQRDFLKKGKLKRILVLFCRRYSSVIFCSRVIACQHVSNSTIVNN